ncbi:hypothetical protein FRB95_014166 [Tulasnella sp. JGI-2019a]|nr:hypothetical protein FRB93_001860 [Tulasnella sp. JGI-2019a]KAG9033844.1 hypothetical protein FRB95_014166 [Tulasnella sp. JGI-2019a]
MDQTAFRSLLDTSKTPGSSSSATTSRPSLLSSGAAKSKKPSEAQPNFKPRKVVKKTLPAGYRDRATERRAGVNDYAEVEAIRDDFEKRAVNAEDKEVVEQERRYLGGDETHTVLVKGLDFALLEQKKAQMQSTDAVADDEALEEAFQAAAEPTTTIPQKRSRNDIISDLKGKRPISSTLNDGVDETVPPIPEVAALEKAKKMGKFKPIGAPATETKVKEEKRKKKKRKVVEAEPLKKGKVVTALSELEPTAPAASVPALAPPEYTTSPVEATITTAISHETKTELPALPILDATEPVDDDIDIFADAGEYEGLDLGDEDEGDAQEQPAAIRSPRPRPTDEKDKGTGPIKRVNWFNEPSPEPIQQDEPEQPEASSSSGKKPALEEGEQEEEAVPTRLVPLASSSIADVKAFLAVDKALEKKEKRKARKEKNKKKDA